MKKILAVIGLFSAALLTSYATVSVTGGSGGTNISADKAANATSPAWSNLAAIQIAEQNGAGGRGDFGVIANGTLVLKAPTGFEFNTNQRPSVTFTSGQDITGAAFVSMDSTTLTVSVTVGGNTKNDTFVIGSTTNLQVRPTSGSVLTNGAVYRPSTGGGTLVMSGVTTTANLNGSGGTSFASLSEVAGSASKLAFVQSPGGAKVGAAFVTQPIVRTQDQFGNNTSAGLTATVNVTFALNSGTGPLLGTTVTNIGTTGANGIINSSDLRIDSTGADKQLIATASGLTSALSSVFTVNKGDQTISFPAIANHAFGDAPFTIGATASSALPVTFSVVSGAATNSGGTITITGAGVVTVQASQAGDANWNAAPSTNQSFTVTKATPAVTWSNPADIIYGTALDGTQLNATASVPGTFVYSPPAGTVLNAASNQTLSVTFTPTDSANYSNATASVSINVAKADQTITFGALSDKVTSDAPFTIAATASSGLSVSFTIVSGPATISGNTVTLSGATGTVTVRASQLGNGNYNAAPNVDQSFNVNSGTPAITWNTPSDIPYGTALGTNQLNATATIAGTFSYSPEFGTVLPLGSNQVLSVTFTPTDTNSYSIASTNVMINVIKATPIITWATPSPIVYGTALSASELNATANVSGVLTYSPDFGTVLNAGSNQVLSVTFVPDDTTNYNNASATVSLAVLKVIPTVTWSNAADISYGTPLTAAQLNATSSVGGSFVYTPDFGAVLNAGTNQNLSVTFTPADTTNYATVSATISINVLKVTPTISWATPAAIVYGTALTTNQLNATASVAGTFVYTPALGTILNAGNNQTLSVTFTPTDAVNYNGAVATVSIDVAKASSTITWATPADISYGTALSTNQLKATASTAGSFAYTPDVGTILNAGMGQTLAVIFTPTDTNNFYGTNATVAINVLKATPTINWSSPAPIVYGMPLSATQLNATSPVPGTFAYSPTNGTVLNAGTNQTLSVAFVPTDGVNYSNATVTVSINVLKATPVITWSNPADIVYGTPLGGTQLNASASVAGTLNYTPAAGTILNAGNNQSLSVSFVPTDANNYKGGTTNVVINVLKAPTTITWNNPADITYGTPLSATQLSATASTPGTFVYTPVAGAVLNAGTNQNLSVSFTPSLANYSNATASIAINVLKAPLTIKANDATRLVGQSNPAFSASFTGFVNADTAANLTLQPTFSTIADTNSPIGFYDITPSGAASGNYNITYLNGTLTVAPTNTVVSTSTGGNWSAPGTWVGGVVPVASDNVVVVAGATVTVDTAASCFSLTLSNSVASGATLNISATRSLSVGSGSGAIVIGQNQTALSAGSTTLLNVAGVLQAGNVTLTARRLSNRNADAILRVSNAAASVTVSNNIVQDRNVVTGGLTSQVEFTAAGLLKIGGGFVAVGSGGTFSAGTGTIEYFANGDQTITGFAYNNLTLSGSGTKTGSAAVSIGATGTLLLKDTVIYAGATPTYAAGSTLFYARTGAQVTGTALPLTAPANWNLSLSNSSGITLRQSATVTGTLRLVAGTITTTATNILTADGTVIRTVGYVIGNLRKNFGVGANIAQTFEVGTISNYSPISITFSNVATAGHVTMVASAGKHAAIGSSVLNPSKGVNVTWRATPDVLVADGYNAVFNFSASDVDAGASTGLFVVGAYNGGAWSYPAVGGRTASSVQATGLTAFGDFQVGESGMRSNPTITWSNPADIVYGTALDSNQLNATADVPGSFVYTPASGTVLNAGNGQTLSVTFTPDDLVSYNPVTATVSLNVLKVTPSITWNNPSDVFYGTALSGAQLNATANVPGLLVYSPDSGAVLNAGTNTLSVTFTPADTTNYNIANASVSLVVLKATPTLTWNTPAPIAYGVLLDTNQLNTTSSAAGAFAYSPSSGSLLPVGTNVLTVTFTPSDVANYNVVTNSVLLVVNQATPVITWAMPTDITYNTPLGTNQLNATASIAGSFVYSPDFGTILSVGTNQTLSVTFTPADTNNYTAISTNVAINVLKATPVITWTAPSSLVYGTALSALQLNATADVSGAFTYTPDVGAVLNAGTNVLGVHFVPDDTTNYNNASATVDLVIEKAIPTITWPTPAPIVFGTFLGSAQLNAAADVPGTLNYAPGSGALLNAGTNTLFVNFVPADATNYTVAATNVSIVVLKATPTLSWNPPLPIVYGTPLTGTELSASADVDGTFNYSPVAGTVLNAGTHTLSATFIPADPANYNVGSTNVSITVQKAATTVTWSNPSAITYGTALGSSQLNASASVPGTLVYSPAAGTILNAGTNVLSVTFVPADTTNYLGTNATVNLVVKQATPTVTWATPANIVYGTALDGTQLNASADVAGSFSYTPSSGTILPVGTHTLTVDFAPADSVNYSTASTNVSLVVTMAASSISWTNPTGIVYGTALTTNELNATANVAGSFTYSPDLGAVLPTGTNVLSASFIPDDPTNYSGATTTVEIVIAKRDLVVFANNAIRQYGLTNPAFSGTVSGVVAGDNISATYGSGAAVGSDIGDYAIVPLLVDPLGKLTNYAASVTNGTLTVIAAPLTVVAANQTKAYGASNPALTGSVVGVRNGDDITANYSTTADTSSAVGSYPITISISDPGTRIGNYSLSTTNGVLTVIADTPSVSLDSAINPAPIGAAVSFTAILSGTYIPITNGLVQFIVDSTNVIDVVVTTNGTANSIVRFDLLGNHSVQANYLGDLNRNPVSSLALSETVNALPIDVLAVIPKSNGSMVIRFAGDGVSGYTIQRSVDLMSWSNFATPTPGADGLLDVTDVSAASQSYRFYRAVKN